MSIQTSIDGFRLIAQRSNEYAGQTVPEWCALDGKWTDVWLSDDAPAAARVGVYRRGFAEALVRTVTWREFGATSATWKSMPGLMLAKVAESQALRAAFPMELSGLYTSEEMAASDDGFSKVAPPPSDRAPVRQDVEQGWPKPDSWAELEELIRHYGEMEWAAHREFTAQACQHLFETRDTSKLSPDQRTVLWQKAAGAGMRLLDAVHPDRFPPPSREEIRVAFAAVLEGEALEGPDWRMSPDEDDRPVWTPEGTPDEPTATEAAVEPEGGATTPEADSGSQEPSDAAIDEDAERIGKEVFGEPVAETTPES
jgi:hypothetical protein